MWQTEFFKPPDGACWYMSFQAVSIHWPSNVSADLHTFPAGVSRQFTNSKSMSCMGNAVNLIMQHLRLPQCWWQEFCSSVLLHWVAGLLIPKVLKEHTDFIFKSQESCIKSPRAPWPLKMYVPSKYQVSITLLLSTTQNSRTLSLWIN